MPTTAQDLINRALRSLLVIGQGESADADQSADMLVLLNDMLEDWSIDNNLLYVLAEDTVVLTPGKQAYTMAVGAYDINSIRPVSIEQAYVRRNGIDYPIEIAGNEKYNSITAKGLSGDMPEIMSHRAGAAVSTISLWPIPASADTLIFHSTKALTGFPLLSTTVEFPAGYSRAIRLNLAVEAMPEFERENAVIRKMALDAKNAIKRINIETPSSSFDPAIPSRNNGYDIYSDQ